MRVHLAAMLVLLSGCLAQPPVPQLDDASGATPWWLEDLLAVDHDHKDPTTHAVSRGMELVASVNTVGDRMKGSWLYDIHLEGDRLYSSLRGAKPGLVIADTSALPQLPLVGFWPTTLDVADVHVSQDRKMAAVATQGRGAGIAILDLSDEIQPKLVAEAAIPPVGVHTVQLADIGGKRYLFAQPAGEQGGNPCFANAMAPCSNTPFNSVLIYEVASTAAGTQLRPVSKYQAEVPPADAVPGAPVGTRWQFPHDVRIQVHPITGKTLLYVAYWNAGLRIVDVSDPASPREVSRNLEMGASKFLQLHDVYPLPELQDGRHITLTSPELFIADEPGTMRVYDTTDPAKPTLIGEWRIPQADLNVNVLRETMHRLFYADGTVYIAHRHYGMWVLDISTPERLREPQPLGMWADYTGDAGAIGASQLLYPGYNDVGVVGGHIIATQQLAGFHVLRLAAAA